MKKFVTILGTVMYLLGFVAVANAQEKGTVEFDKLQYSFGDIKEEGGPQEVVFNFKNTGKAPLKITKVQASCGCTTPEWTKELVKPGEEGHVKASYNPKNRPGPFNKSITVWTNGQPEIVVLRINGKVTPKPKGPEDFYPMAIGNLRFQTTHIVFGDVVSNGVDTASTVVYNAGEKAVKLNLEATKVPNHIEFTASKATIEPKETVTLSFKYDAAKKNDWGYLFDYFKLMTDDSDRPEKRINISANIKENFGEITADTKLPKVKFDKVKHDFGTIEEGTKVSTTFTLTNNGDAPMIIRKTKASCGCTATRPQKMNLAPGESTVIDVTFNSRSRTGKQRKTITVICNDPKTPQTTLWIEADVQKGTGSQGN